MAVTIAVANQKGGVGKTATAVNLAAGLALEGKRCLLVDLDSQGSASSGVGVAAERGLSTYEVLIGATSILNAVKGTVVEGLDVLASGRDLAGAEVELVDCEERHARLRGALQPVQDRYEYILIDCPPALGMLTLNALCAADSVLVPLQCEFYALEGLSALLDTIARVRGTFRPDLRLEGILLTMYDARTSLSRQVAREVRGHFGTKVFHAMIPRNVRIGESPSHGLPVLIYDATCSGAAAYRQVARELAKQYGGAADLAEPESTEAKDATGGAEGDETATG